MSILMIYGKQTGGYIFLVVSGEFPLAVTCSEKKRPEKIPFIATDNWIVLAVRRCVKSFFDPNFPIFQESCGEKEDGENRQMQSAFLSSKRKNE